MENRFKETDVILGDMNWKCEDYKLLSLEPLPFMVIRPDKKHEMNIAINYVKDQKHHRKIIQFTLEKE